MSTFATLAKNISTFATLVKSGMKSYLLTDDSSYILVGSAENERLLLQDTVTWTVTSKN